MPGTPPAIRCQTLCIRHSHSVPGRAGIRHDSPAGVALMELDPLLLSRLQFAFVVCFHAIFPVFTIGLATFIAFLEMLAFRTGNPAWSRLSQFWIQVFAVAFAMGVVSGIVMSFQFGTNWSNFSYAA